MFAAYDAISRLVKRFPGSVAQGDRPSAGTAGSARIHHADIDRSPRLRLEFDLRNRSTGSGTQSLRAHQVPHDAMSQPRPETVSFTTEEGTWINFDVSPGGGTIVSHLPGDLYTIPVTGGEATLLLDGPAWQMHPRMLVRLSPPARSLKISLATAGRWSGAWLCVARLSRLRTPRGGRPSDRGRLGDESRRDGRRARHWASWDNDTGRRVGAVRALPECMADLASAGPADIARAARRCLAGGGGAHAVRVSRLRSSGLL